jgi:hypothetical protein
MAINGIKGTNLLDSAPVLIGKRLKAYEKTTKNRTAGYLFLFIIPIKEGFLRIILLNSKNIPKIKEIINAK